VSAGATLVTFRWDGELWAFDLADVMEVAGARPVTPVPGTGRRMLGIVAWRGRTLPVLAPRRLKADPAPPDLRGRFLVLRVPSPFAVPVDEPGRVVTGCAVVAAAREAAAASGAVRAVVRVEGARVQVLDPRVLAADGVAPEREREPAPEGER
jgi:chemotaxis signal transduction protein